jgi:hypothetical protein
MLIVARSNRVGLRKNANVVVAPAFAGGATATAGIRFLFTRFVNFFGAITQEKPEMDCTIWLAEHRL